MFCFQCQETVNNSGCILGGVCGKQPATAAAMDMLLFAARGLASVAAVLLHDKQPLPPVVHLSIQDALFATITNANFDDQALEAKTRQLFSFRDSLAEQARSLHLPLPPLDEVSWCGSPADYPAKAAYVGVQRYKDEDVRSLKELITYGLKGIAAYLHHARSLGQSDGGGDDFIVTTLADLANPDISVKRLNVLVRQTGSFGIRAMATLDLANTNAYGHPTVTRVSTLVGQRPGILVSGHDLRDLEQLLRQCADKGVDVYTHGEMLPAHYYPFFAQSPALVAHYGGAWWRQRDEFELFCGPILFTSNCIVPPLPHVSYKRRIFTTGPAGLPGCTHIVADEQGYKDFSPIIDMALSCPPPQSLPRYLGVETDTILGGFAHNQFDLLAPKVVAAIKNGSIKRFVVMAGCDGRQAVRTYYSHYARQLPTDTVILTAGCAKYRYNQLDLGSIDGIPRIIDAGQCNDAYSLILIALKLQELLGVKNINDLPIYYNIAWYEQKAVIVLLSLLTLGVKNIHLGPTLPAFLSPNVVRFLESDYGLVLTDRSLPPTF